MSKSVVTLDSSVQKQYRTHVNCWQGCTDCELSRNREKAVLYRGTLPADFLFIGEAPGQDENREGKPFIGKAGEVLQVAIDLLLEELESLSLPLFTYGITNIVACYPGKDRHGQFNKPTDEQAEACSQRLYEIVELCNPRLVFLLGETAKTYANRIAGRRTVGVYHPSYILRRGGIGNAAYRSWWNSIAKEVASVYAKT